MFNVDHIGIAVSDLDEAIKLYEEQFKGKLILTETLPQHGIKLAFIDTGNTLIELLEPLDDSSMLAKFLKNRGPGLHHICFEVKDIKAELARYEANGFKLIDKNPRPGAFNSQIAFIHPESTAGTLIELCQRGKKEVAK